MEYQEFKNCMVKKLKDFYGNDADVHLLKVRKTNGIDYEGIFVEIEREKTWISPIVWLETLYGRFESGRASLDRCVGMIVDAQRETDPDPEMKATTRFMDWEISKNHVYPVLCRGGENGNLPNNMLCRQVLDLSCYFILRMPVSPELFITTKVTKYILRMFKVSEEVLYRQALANMEKGGYLVKELREIINEMLKEHKMDGKDGIAEPLPVEEMEPEKLRMVTNRVRLFGAAAMLDRELMKKVSGGKDMFILPSSIHEVMVLEASDKVEQNELDEMVREVNAICVDRDEQLSDHAYFYDASKGEIRNRM